MEQFQQWRRRQEGKLGYILLWALGVPIPVLFVIFLVLFLISLVLGFTRRGPVG